MSEELAVIDVAVDDVAVRRPPEEVLAEATRAAKCLKSVLDGKPKKVVFNGERYLENEDWQTIGRFYNLTARITDCKYVEAGEAWGYQARAVVLTSEYREVSEAFASCFSDEPNWKHKPRFQLESMAQTRACSKALRNVLAFVPVLAGYRPTPAEEMDGMAQRVEQTHSQQHNRPTPPQTPSEPPGTQGSQMRSPSDDDSDTGHVRARPNGSTADHVEEYQRKSGMDWLKDWMAEKMLPGSKELFWQIVSESLGRNVDKVKEVSSLDWAMVKAHCEALKPEDILGWESISKNAVEAGK